MSTQSNLIKRLLALAVLVSMGLTHIACNTMEGAGKDMERGGEKLQDAADRNK